MSDDHDQRAECAAEFAKVHGVTNRLSNGHATQADALAKLTGAVEKSNELRHVEHGEAMREMRGFASQVLTSFGQTMAAVGDTNVSVAKVEQKATSAHKRLDTINKVIIGIAVAFTASVLVASVIGLAKYIATTSGGG